MGSRSTTRPTATSVTSEEFKAALDRYDQIIEGVSAAKSAKPGQKSLAELDRHRYEEAPTLFCLDKPDRRAMQLEDVKTLVEWKLKHGKFRPTLMKLVASNDHKFVEDTVKGALQSYEEKADAAAAVDLLTKLKGIGPATASLLLAVHDPDKVIFFADEAFWWLCCGSRRDPIKYNAKEYKELLKASHSLAERLGVRAIDAERVAYVLLHDESTSSTVRDKAPTAEKGAETTAKNEKASSSNRARAAVTKPKPEPAVNEEELSDKKPTPVKRKQGSAVQDTSNLRRSKRGKTN